MDKYYLTVNNILVPVSSKHIDYSKKIDKNNDHILDDQEITDFLIKNDDLKIKQTREGFEIIKRII
jgi:hypothetical protein